MRIILLGTAWPYRGGLAAFNERLMQEFAQEGDHVSIQTFTLQYPAFLFPGEKQTDDRPAPDIDIQRTLSSVNPLSWIRAARFIKKEKPDLLIIKFWTPFLAPALGYVAGAVRKNKHTKVICIADNIVPHEKHFYDRMLTKYFIKRMDAFVVMSKQVLTDLALFDRKKLRATNPHPLFDNFGERISKAEACRALGLDPGKKYVLFFGFIRDYKGLDLLLDAFSDARILQEDIHLIVAGEFYTERKGYDIMMHSLGNRVHLFDRFISDAEVRNFFCAADLVAQPYKHAT
ncbi:MAG: glycosyltransferase, partial [Chitinophagales bacterium]